MNDIDNLVVEHNEAEVARYERLKRLYNLLAQRRGYRSVRFTSDMWSVGAWDQERAGRPDLAYRAHIEPMQQFITEVVQGEEKIA